MDTTIKTQSQLASVNQFDCSNCGSALEVINPRAKYVACQYCGSVLDANSETHQILQQLADPGRHKPMSFIHLGQIAEFDGIPYQVIARTRWRSKYKEYWSEEGQSGYSNEVWVYDEWLLISPDRTYFYLIEDREGFKVSEEIIPDFPSLVPENLRMNFFKENRKKIVQEFGNSEVIYFEGESNYQIRQGDQIRFGMYKDRGIAYSVEYRMANQNQGIKEVEFFKETPIARRRILEAFSENEAIDQLRQKEGFWKYVFRMSSITWLVLLFMWFISFVAGEEVVRESFSIQSISDQTSVETKAFTLEPGLYNFNLQANFTDNNVETFIFTYLIDEAEGVINTLSGEFFYYSGYEGGESWTESSLSNGKLFRLKETRTLRVQLLRDSTELAANGQVSVVIEGGVWLSRYFFYALLIMLIPLLMSRSRYKA